MSTHRPPAAAFQTLGVASANDCNGLIYAFCMMRTPKAITAPIIGRGVGRPLQALVTGGSMAS